MRKIVTVLLMVFVTSSWAQMQLKDSGGKNVLMHITQDGKVGVGTTVPNSVMTLQTTTSTVDHLIMNSQLGEGSARLRSDRDTKQNGEGYLAFDVHLPWLTNLPGEPQAAPEAAANWKEIMRLYPLALGIGSSNPEYTLSVGSSNGFAVNSAGNIRRLYGLDYQSWPTSHVAGFLKNDGAGTLTWEAVSSGTNFWQRNGTRLAPATVTDFVGIGTTYPTVQLHTTSGVRFAGISSTVPASPRVVVMDDAGVLARTAAGASNTFLRSDGAWVSTPEIDGVIGNEVTGANVNATLLRYGTGTSTDPYTLGLNLARANVWTGKQTMSAGADFPASGVWNTSGYVGIGVTNPSMQLHTTGGVRFAGIGSTIPSAPRVVLMDANGVLAKSGTSSGNTFLRSDGTWQSVLLSEIDGIIGNEVTQAGDATLTRTGTGIASNPYGLQINLGNPNTWTAKQTFSVGAAFPNNGIWSATGMIGVGNSVPRHAIDVNLLATDYGDFHNETGSYGAISFGVAWLDSWQNYYSNFMHNLDWDLTNGFEYLEDGPAALFILGRATNIGGAELPPAFLFRLAQRGVKGNIASFTEVMKLAFQATNNNTLDWRVSTLPSGTGSNLVINGGRIYQATSSRRYKEDIQPLQTNFAQILNLQPVAFTYKDSQQKGIGYVAEDLDEMGLKELVNYDASGQPDGIQYDKIALYLLEVVKKQNKELVEIRQELNTLRK